MMQRRTFIKRTCGAALGSLVLAGCSTDEPRVETTSAPMVSSARSLEQIGVQLYTLRSLMEEDVSGTLASVAEIGYDEVEFAGYFGHRPQEIRAMLEKHGLSAPAAHISLEASQNNLAEAIEAAQTIGHRYLIVAYLQDKDRETLDQYRQWAAHFNEVGVACREAGLQFAYHNHDFEFEPKDGQLPYDVLLAETDPDLVQMEIDLYWIAKAGHDPLAYFARYPGRFPLCHVKDGDAEYNQTSVGNGVIDFAAIFAHAEQAGLRHYFMEMDNPPEPLANVRQSHQYLEQLQF